MLHGLSRCTCHESSLSSSREQFHLIVGVTFSNRGLERNSPCPMSFRSFSLISCIRKCEVTVLECYTDTVVTRSWCSRLNKMCVCVFVWVSEWATLLQRRDLPLLSKENRPCTGSEAPCGNKRWRHWSQPFNITIFSHDHAVVCIRTRS